MKVRTHTPDGHLIEVSSTVLDLDKRIKYGDPTANWSGDTRMFLRFHALTEQYQVWRLCEDGVERIICSWPPEQMDARLLRHLGETDGWRRGADVLGKLDAQNAALERQHQEAQAELEAGIREIMDFAMRRSHIPGDHRTKDSYGVGSISRHLPKGHNGSIRNGRKES